MDAMEDFVVNLQGRFSKMQADLAGMGFAIQMNRAPLSLRRQ